MHNDPTKMLVMIWVAEAFREAETSAVYHCEGQKANVLSWFMTGYSLKKHRPPTTERKIKKSIMLFINDARKTRFKSFHSDPPHSLFGLNHLSVSLQANVLWEATLVYWVWQLHHV